MKTSIYNGLHLRNHVKTVIISLRLQGGRIQDIAKGMGVSTRSVWEIIRKVKYRYLGSFFWYDNRRIPRANRSQLMKVKIARTSHVLASWIGYYDLYGIFDLQACLSGTKPP